MESSSIGSVGFLSCGSQIANSSSPRPTVLSSIINGDNADTVPMPIAQSVDRSVLVLSPISVCGVIVADTHTARETALSATSAHCVR